MEHPHYCESPIFSYFFEPLNTITNLFFMIVGYILIVQLKKGGKLDSKAVYLSSLMILIGIGSFAWHFYRSNITLLADSIPIAVFVISYLYFYLAHITKKNIYRFLLFLGFFIYTPILTILLNSYPLELFGNGGAGYIAAISYFLLLQFYNYINSVPVISKSLLVILVFLISIFARQIDMYVCEWLGFGTHFIWHILNSLVLYLMVKLLYAKARTA
jgi:hypothetical protein